MKGQIKLKSQKSLGTLVNTNCSKNSTRKPVSREISETSRIKRRIMSQSLTMSVKSLDVEC